MLAGITQPLLALYVQGAVLTVIAQQRLQHMLNDVRAGNVAPGQHRGSEQDLQQMAEVAKYVAPGVALVAVALAVW